MLLAFAHLAALIPACFAGFWDRELRYRAADDGLQPFPVQKRDSSGFCISGGHTCLDIGTLGDNLCCPNDSYCVVSFNNTTGSQEAGCCPLGSTCGNLCSENTYLCNATATASVGGASVGGRAVTTSSACCDRPCQSTNFACPSSVGGGCCRFGQICLSYSAGALCLNTGGGSTTTSNVACTATGSFECGNGGLCCNGSESCTSAAGLGFQCATSAGQQLSSTAFTLLPTSPAQSSADSGTKSVNGVAIGVGVGVPVGLILVGTMAFVWFRVRKRRNQSAQEGGGGWDRTELDAVGTTKKPVELDDLQILELDDLQIHELGEHNNVTELPDEEADAGLHELPGHAVDIDAPPHENGGPGDR